MKRRLRHTYALVMVLVSQLIGGRDSCAQAKDVTATQFKPVLFCWLDDLRLLFISQDIEDIGNRHKMHIEGLGGDEMPVSIYVLDFNVVDAQRGLTPISFFPSQPRLNRFPNIFELENLQCDFGMGDVLKKELFLRNLSEPYRQENELVCWLRGLYFHGWKYANVYRLLGILPVKCDFNPEVAYCGEKLELETYVGRFEPLSWASTGSLPEAIARYNAYQAPVWERDARNSERARLFPYDMRYAKRMVERYPNKIDGYLLMAELQSEAQPECAVQYCNQGLKQSPEAAIMYLMRASIYNKNGDTLSALMDAFSAERVAPGYAGAAVEYYQNCLNQGVAPPLEITGRPGSTPKIANKGFEE